MKKTFQYFNLILLVSVISFSSCYEITNGVGFLSDDIYLKGTDTVYIPIGGKGNTNYAWTDNSSQPITFKIENVRDKSGNRSEQFFKQYLYRTWIKPYDFLTDKTLEQVMAKLQEVKMEPVVINPINGQLIYTETTANLSSAGDVFHLDVKVTNPNGSKLIENYAVLKLSSDAKSFVVNEVINGISVVEDGINNFVYYDQINESQPNFIERRKNIYADNGNEFVRIHKISDEPQIGVKVIIKLLDSEDKLFNPEKYATYSFGTYSYIDHSINRKNTSEGMILEFPTTPWPTDVNFRSYLKGPTYTDLSNLNIAQLYEDYKAGKISSLISKEDWPSNNWITADAWYVRIRSLITFYESGTWEISCKVPYAKVN